jgi:hypothetical protein
MKTNFDHDKFAKGFLHGFIIGIILLIMFMMLSSCSASKKCDKANRKIARQVKNCPELIKPIDTVIITNEVVIMDTVIEYNDVDFGSIVDSFTADCQEIVDSLTSRLGAPRTIVTPNPMREHQIKEKCREMYPQIVYSDSLVTLEVMATDSGIKVLNVKHAERIEFQCPPQVNPVDMTLSGAFRVIWKRLVRWLLLLILIGFGVGKILKFKGVF